MDWISWLATGATALLLLHAWARSARWRRLYQKTLAMAASAEIDLSIATKAQIVAELDGRDVPYILIEVSPETIDNGCLSGVGKMHIHAPKIKPCCTARLLFIAMSYEARLSEEMEC